MYLIDHYGVVSNMLCIYTQHAFLERHNSGALEMVRIRPTWEALDQRNCDKDRVGENQATLGGTGPKEL